MKRGERETGSSGPPRLLTWLLSLMLPESLEEPFSGDLEERYRRHCQERGRQRANVWYAWQVVRSRALTLRREEARQLRMEDRNASARRGMTERLLEQFGGDVRYGLRGMRRSPGFSLAAVLTLGLGTGAAVAVFSLVQGVVLRPLPYAEPERLVMLWETQLAQGLEREPVSPVNFMDYRGVERVIEDAAAWWVPEVNLTDEAGEPIRVNTVETSENLFAVLGTDAFVGRTFELDSTLYGSEPEVVISHRLWRSRFGEDPALAGSVVQLNGSPHTVVGVMPPRFHFPDETDVWQRLRWDPSQHTRYAHFMGSVARLVPGIGVSRANAELGVLSARLGEENPGSNGGWNVRAVSLGVDVAGVFRPGLLALLGAAVLLLVIACINVANLLLARGSVRRTEVAVRSAMGASRGRLIGQLLVESGLLAFAGAAVGFVTAVLGLRLFLAWSPVDIPRADEVAIDPAVLGFAILVAVLTALAFGLAPAFALSRTRLRDSLREGSRGGGAGRSSGRARHVFVVAEVALAVVLLSAAGLLIRSVVGMMGVDAGVRGAGVVTANLQLPAAQYGAWPEVAGFYSTLTDNLRSNPAIDAVGGSNVMPLDPGWRLSYGAAGVPGGTDNSPMAQYQTVDEGWSEALGVRLLAGRDFAATDDSLSRPVVIVNEALARRHWSGEDAVGRMLTVTTNTIGPLGARLTESQTTLLDHEIIGVVSDVRNTSLAAEPEPTVYFTQRQFPFRSINLFVRGRGGQQAVVTAVRSEIARLDPGLPLANVTTLDRILAAPADPPRLVMFVLVVFAAVALILAAIGIYGVLSYAVTSRNREIGIRMALGARPRGVLIMIVRQGLLLGAIGALTGVAAATLTGRALARLLFGVEPTDPFTLGAVLLAAMTVCVAACVVPGRRAALTSPIRSLRSE